MLQKLKFIIAPILLAVGFVAPLVVVAPASAAKTYPAGTCFYSGPDGHKIDTCKKLGVTTSQKDTSGKAVSYQNCYEINATTSSSQIVQVNCDNTTIGGTDTTNYCSLDSAGNPVPCDKVSDAAVSSGNCSSANKCDLILKYVNPFINFLAALVGLAVVISIVIGGIQYGSSAGDSAKVTAAKNRIRNSIIALLTFMFLYALLNFLIPGGLM